jgi:UDP-glucose 4-epimerase
MNVLVTGGAGFIGSHIVDRLIKEGHTVLVIDDFSSGSKKFLSKKAIVRDCDIHCWNKVNIAFSEFKPSAVLHLAAKISARDEFPDSKRYASDSMNILNCAKKHGVSIFVFSSSAAVYGDSLNLPIKETELKNPLSPYGHSKLNFESHLLSKYLPKSIKSVALRYANVYGPRQGMSGEGGVVAIFCKKLLSGEPLLIYGNGEQTRDFVFVEDVVESNILALETKKRQSVYNVSTSKEISVNYLIKNLIKISGAKPKLEHKGFNKGEILRSSLDNSLIKKDLGWAPEIKFEDGIKRTWKWFKENY